MSVDHSIYNNNIYARYNIASSVTYYRRNPGRPIPYSDPMSDFVGWSDPIGSSVGFVDLGISHCKQPVFLS